MRTGIWIIERVDETDRLMDDNNADTEDFLLDVYLCKFFSSGLCWMGDMCPPRQRAKGIYFKI